MGYTTERLNNRKFLLTGQDPGAQETYQLQMLSCNAIRPLLEFSVRSVDSSGYYYYDVTGLQSLSVLGGELTFSPESVLNLCQALAELSGSMNEYLLDIDRVRMGAEYVYSTPALDRFLFLYDPDKSVTEDLYPEELRKLFEFVLQHFDHTAERDDTVMVYDIYSRILKGTFDPAACVRMRGEKKEESDGKTASGEMPAVQDAPESAAPSAEAGAGLCGTEEPKKRKKKVPFSIAAILSGILSVGSAGLLIYPGVLPFERNSYMLLGVCTLSAVTAAILAKAAGSTTRKPKIKKKEGYDTLEIEKIRPEGEEEHAKTQRELFDDATSPLPTVWNETEDETAGMYLDDGAGRVFEIEKFPFIVGTNPVCDARLSDRTVSRRHLKLLRIGENIAVTDLGSTNGTTVNGGRIGSGENRVLRNGDVLGLGREHLTIHILT